MDEDREKDLREVMAEEKARGRRRIDAETRRQRAQRLNDARRLLSTATKEEFLEAMRAVGLKDGSQEFEEALRIWREFRP